MKTLSEYLQEARVIPSHVNGVLQPQYKMFKNSGYYHTLYEDATDPAAIFEATREKKRGAEGYYIKTIQTYREDGSIRTKSEWLKKLFFHKKWSRRDVEVTDVTFDVVGLKRETTHLPAAVLISNVKFII